MNLALISTLVLGGMMNRLITLLGAILVSTCSFAMMQPSSLSKNTSPLSKMLSSSWKVQQNHPKLDKNDISMVYGGADVSRRPTLATHTATA